MAYWQEQLVSAFEQLEKKGIDEVAVVDLALATNIAHTDVNMALQVRRKSLVYSVVLIMLIIGNFLY